jgi:competence protein ComEA
MVRSRHQCCSQNWYFEVTVERGSAVIRVLLVTAALVFFGLHRVNAVGPDPDLEAVQAVCGRCHTTAVFLKEPRSWERWNDVFADMTGRGARGTDEQLERVTRYFLENLTLIDINTSPADEISGVLSISDKTAEAIIDRRQRRPFTTLDELRAVPGIDSDKLEQRKSRILF